MTRVEGFERRFRQWILRAFVSSFFIVACFLVALYFLVVGWFLFALLVATSGVAVHFSLAEHIYGLIDQGWDALTAELEQQ